MGKGIGWKGKRKGGEGKGCDDGERRDGGKGSKSRLCNSEDGEILGG